MSEKLDSSQLQQSVDDSVIVEHLPYIPTMPMPGGFFADSEDQSCTVKVAMRIRPMIGKEVREGSKPCIRTAPEENKLAVGQKEFNFDKVFDTETNQEDLFHICAHNLVLGCFSGYNATIIAYGQTGSGKTHTMGTGSTIGLSAEQIGIVPRVFDFIFEELENRRRDPEFSNFEVKVQFLELYGEDIHDLLDTTSVDKLTGQSTKQLKIREEKNGQISIDGLKPELVTSKQECVALLNRGISQRVTSATKMNEGSSRSHAIFTITISQKIIKQAPPSEDGTETQPSEENISAKFHFVDLAGSERIKKTGATGKQMQEGISINKGLLALGNVISYLTDEKKQAAGFVPYRDSKLTRILQDSLGGNSRTTMIACASPADSNLEESLSTVKYAARARNIKNKPKVNRDANAVIIEGLRKQVAQLQSENQQLQQALKAGGIAMPEIKPPEPPKEQPKPAPIQQSTQNANANVSSQELRELKLKLARKEKELKEIIAQQQAKADKDQEHQKELADVILAKDDLQLWKEAVQQHLSKENISLPSSLFKDQPKKEENKDKSQKSLVDEYKAKLSQLQANFQAKEKELAQKTQKMAEMSKKLQTDEAVIKKNIGEIDRLKRELASKPPVQKVVIQERSKQPQQQQQLDVEDMKTKLMDKFTSQLENIFVQNENEPSAQDIEKAGQIADEAKNSTLDDKEKMIQAVQQSQEKFRNELSELFSNSWNSKITDLKNSMKQAEADQKQKIKESKNNDQTAKLEKEYKAKMDDLARQLDQQQREKSKKEEAIHKQAFLQETRIKSLETELQKIRKENEEIKDQKKFGEDRFKKFKESTSEDKQKAQKELQQHKKNLSEKDKALQKVRQDLKKTEAEANQKIEELKKIQKRAYEEKKKREREEEEEMQKGVDIHSIKDWIKLNTDALLNQQELQNYLKEQSKQRDEIEDEMLHEGDRLTELIVQKERLIVEKEMLIEAAEVDEARMLEIEQELDDVLIESDSITQTLETLEEHLNYVCGKVDKLEEEIGQFDPDSIKPPGFKGLNSVEVARATMKTFFMVLLDLNVYKRELETKCIDQDETILELQGTINLLQERVGLSAGQREVMMQKQRMINQMINKMGDTTDYIDSRGQKDLGLSLEEQNQLTKMSLSKIVNNLRTKLKEEEQKAKALQLKIQQLMQEKDAIKNKMENVKREKSNQSYKPQPEPKKPVRAQVQTQRPTSRQQQQSSSNEVESIPEEEEKSERRLSFKERREIKKQQNTPEKNKQKPKSNGPPAQPNRNKARDPIASDLIKQNAKFMEEEEKKRNLEKERQQKYVTEDVVLEQEDEEGSSEDEQPKYKPKLFKFDEAMLNEADNFKDDSKKPPHALHDDTTVTTAEPSVIISQNENDTKWQLQPLLEVDLGEFDSAKLINYDTHGERLFILFSNLKLVEANTATGKVVQTTDLFEILKDAMTDPEKERKARAFALNQENTSLALSTQEAVYLVNYDNTQALKFITKIDTPYVDFISFAENIYIVLMACSDDDDSEACLSCHMIYGGIEGELSIKRFMGQQVRVKCAPNCVIFTCGKQIGRVTVPEMQLEWQEDSKHDGHIVDFDVNETCIYTTGEDSSLRLFDAETGMMLIAPMEDMECDRVALEQEYIIARCGQGQAMLVLKYTEGEEELEEIDFIDLQSETDPGSLQQHNDDFRMKGGHQLKENGADSPGDEQSSAILLAKMQAQHLHIQVLKNRSYIT